MKFPGLIDSFSELIATPSVSSVDANIDQSNQAVVTKLANWLEDLGASVEILPVTGKPDKFNLIACFGSGEDGLVLSGHTDTVPYNEAAWEHDPFKLQEKDNRLYGLGTADMKCFFPLVMDSVSRLDVKQLKHPVYVVATADEESSMAGAMSLLNEEVRLGRFAVIGEPTGLQPVNRHKGVMMESIRLLGKAGHSSDPSLGLSAIEGMNGVINALKYWRSELQRQYQDSHFALPVPTLNFGIIHGGDNPNRISAECELKLDIRLLPAMKPEKIRQSLRDCVDSEITLTGLGVEYHALLEGIEGMVTRVDSEIVQQAVKLSGAEPVAVAFATEGPFLNALGMETVILGPGNIEQAHQANEYLYTDRIKPMLKIIDGLIHRFCYVE